MGGFFNLDSPFSRFMSRVFDLMLLNIIFIITSLPIVTIGPAICSLYYVTLKMAKNEEGYIFKSYFKAFKENFKQGAIIGIIMMVSAVVLYVDLYWSNHIGNSTGKILSIIFLAIYILWGIIYSYIFPIQSKFINNIKTTFKNSFIMGIMNIKFTIAIVLLNALYILVSFISPSLGAYASAIYLFIGFSLVAFVNSLMFNKIFEKYIPEENVDGDEIISADAQE